MTKQYQGQNVIIILLETVIPLLRVAYGVRWRTSRKSLNLLFKTFHIPKKEKKRKCKLSCIHTSNLILFSFYWTDTTVKSTFSNQFSRTFSFFNSALLKDWNLTSGGTRVLISVFSHIFIKFSSVAFSMKFIKGTTSTFTS